MKTPSYKLPLLTLLFIAILAVSAQAVTCSVPTAGYPTIQAAVDDTACTTVNVAPGVYPENVTITRGVTLNGAQAGQPVGSRISAGPGESTVQGANPTGANPVFMIGAPGVTIDGFTIKNLVTTGAAIGVQVQPGSNDAVMLNNFLDGIESTDIATGTAQGVFVQNGSVNVHIGNNEIRNVTSAGAASGILGGDSSLADGTDILYVHDNGITGVTSSADGAYAIRVVKASLTSTSCNFISNRFTDLSGAAFVRAVSFECDLRAPLVLNSDFTGLTSPSADVTAVWINNDPNAYTASISGNNFNLTIADYGIKVQGATTFPPPMNAGCNWWGSPDGPGPVATGHGARISPDIVYAPWRVAPTPDSCIGNNVPMTEDDCKNGGWIIRVRADGSKFKSQGDCVQYVNNGH